jgi:hypothetical protein
LVKIYTKSRSWKKLPGSATLEDTYPLNIDAEWKSGTKAKDNTGQYQIVAAGMRVHDDPVNKIFCTKN